jgi:uncharacterized metal-binding protein YceD (DUF177 family)
MLRIFIQGLKDGIYEINSECGVEEIDGMFDEFIDNVKVIGTLRIWGSRFALDMTATCNAKLLCDISLEEYIEPISAELKLSYIADEDLYRFGKDSDIAKAEERIIHPDDKYIDITEEVRQELTVNLPMKRIAPEYRDKDIKEIYPKYTATENLTIEDAHWAELKKIKFN